MSQFELRPCTVCGLLDGDYRPKKVTYCSVCDVWLCQKDVGDVVRRAVAAYKRHTGRLKKSWDKLKNLTFMGYGDEWSVVDDAGGGVLFVEQVLSGAPSFSYVQSGAVGSNTNQIKCASAGGTGNCTSNVTSGNLLIVIAHQTTATTITSDTQGLTWTPICAGSVACGPSGSTADANGCIHSGSGPTFLCVYYSTATSSGAETVTVSQFTTGLAMLEFHRTSGVWALDVAAGLIGGFNAAATTNPSAAVAGAGELIIGFADPGGVTTYVVGGSINTLDSGLPTPYIVADGYKLSGGSGAQTFAFTLGSSSNWTCSGAAFK